MRLRMVILLAKHVIPKSPDAGFSFFKEKAPNLSVLEKAKS